MNHPGASTKGPRGGGEIDIPNPRNLAVWFNAKFDQDIDQAEAVRLRNILVRLAQPGAEASADLMKEIGALPPKARAALLMMLGVMGRGTIPGG